MCGITGVIAFSEAGKKYLDGVGDAVRALRHRGPDGEGIFRDGNLVLGHTRLAVIDTSGAAAQPFTSADGRFTIVFNGEIFNYRELRTELEKDGATFRTQSDTEVLLALYAKEKEKCLPKLNGFFAFAVYDKNDASLFLARDRFGEKPLYFFRDKDVLIFGSEVKAVLASGKLTGEDPESFLAYFHLNYLPGDKSFFRGITKSYPGFYWQIGKNGDFKGQSWYTLPQTRKDAASYEDSSAQLRKLVDRAVERRLISDVPLGSFLSGGVDSSIITALAKNHKAGLETFSIGFADEPYFDETKYATLVSQHLGTRHHVFSLTNKDLLESLHEFLSVCDVPFADSSALAVNLLAKETRKYVTVALSGDGADELFAGYNKHEAELRIRSKSKLNALAKRGSLLWNVLPASRNSAFGNRIRQLRKFAEGMDMEPLDRYWNWAGFYSEAELKHLIPKIQSTQNPFLLSRNPHSEDFNDVLSLDMEMVLEGDMLVKVDRMSMLHALEVRPPFLDHEVVDFVMQLPAEYKIQPGNRKRILKDTFRDLLPEEIFHRKKQGFEVPLLNWFRGELRGLIDELLDEKFLREQQIFNPVAVKELRRQLHSSDPDDSAAKVWALIVFQTWWKKHIG
jgi:asparagine synthase (glutamine-hydrolysing)